MIDAILTFCVFFAAGFLPLIAIFVATIAVVTVVFAARQRPLTS